MSIIDRLSALGIALVLLVGLPVACTVGLGSPTEQDKAVILDASGDNDVIGEALDGEEVIFEDDKRWDCRTMGNMVCGVDIKGTWYLVQFADGQPVSIAER